MPRGWRSEVLVGAIAAVAGAAIVVARVAEFPAFTPFTQTLAFYPLVGVAALVLAVVAAIRHHWLIGGCLAVPALAIALTSWPAGAEAAAAPAGSTPVRVVSSNVNLGAATQPLIDRLAAEPVATDVLFIVECNVACAHILAGSPASTMFPYRRIDEAPGPAGSAILSRTPLTERPQQPQGPGQFAMPTAEVELGGVPVALKAAHPYPPTVLDLGRWRSGLDELEQFSAGARSAVLIGGDFNATPYNGAYRAVLGERLSDATPAAVGTWPSDAPAILGTPIDHILFSEPFGMSASGTWNLEGSDHRTVWADLWIRS